MRHRLLLVEKDKRKDSKIKKMSQSCRVHFITIEGANEKVKQSTRGKEYAQVRENWINKFLYTTPIGVFINLSLLITITGYYLLTIADKLRDEKFFTAIIEAVYVPAIVQFFMLYVPLDVLMHLVLIGFLFPLSRLSRSTHYYWFIGVLSVVIISSIAYFDVYATRTIVLTRLALSIECARLSMKVAAFLFECNESEQVFEDSTLTTFIYYLCIPHFIYKVSYKKIQRRRWFRIICHMWWLMICVFPFGTFVFEHVLPRLVFDVADGFTAYAMFAVYLALTAFFGYFVVVWFFAFANYLSLHGELLKFADHRFMGTCNLPVRGLEVASEINIITSKWFARYCYVPVVKSTDSRFLGLSLAFTITAFWHEFVLAYTFNQICFITIPLVSLAPLVLYNEKNSFFVRIKIFVIFVTVVPFWWVMHPIEFLAWNYSTIPNIQDESKWRLVPLFITYNIENNLIPWFNQHISW